MLTMSRRVQAAAVVHHDHDLLRTKLALGDAERADRIVGDQAAGVANQMGVAALEPEHRKQVDARVHTGEHRHFALRPWAEPGRCELLGARSGDGEHVIRVGHPAAVTGWAAVVCCAADRRSVGVRSVVDRSTVVIGVVF